MKLLYLILDASTLFFPVVLSFDKNIRYHKSWKNSFLASLIIAIPFLVWDILFTNKGFWGFNPDYITGLTLFNLPIEEILFFIVVPFACTFIYEVCKYYFRRCSMSVFNKVFHFAIPIYAFVLVAMGSIGYYTSAVVISSTVVLVWMLFNSYLKYVSLAFVISLIPFFVMNGILTGVMTEDPIVWYSEAQKVKQEIFTIPLEDILYSFTLVVSNILLFEKLQKKQGA